MPFELAQPDAANLQSQIAGQATVHEQDNSESEVQSNSESIQNLRFQFGDFSQVPVHAPPIQRQVGSPVDSRPPTFQPANNTGLPDNLKSGVEALSGYSMDDVQVHYNSSKPAGINAHAYAQGTEIHLGPGQEKHLPHEAWHVVQQKQGRVTANDEVNGQSINSDRNLESEATTNGNLALQSRQAINPIAKQSFVLSNVIQRHIEFESSSPGPPPKPGRFVVDNSRPGFIKPVSAMAITASQNRDHIVAFESIQNDLAIRLNRILGTSSKPARKAEIAEFIQWTETLFLTKHSWWHKDMIKKRTQLIAALGPPLDQAKAHRLARSLLSRLNSNPDNVRPGDASTNQSIGENLDPDFLPGVQVVGAGGLQVEGSAGKKTLPAGTQYLRLKATHEELLHGYQTETTQDLSFVIDPAKQAQMSSVAEPTPTAGGASVANLPVVVFGPPGTVPFIYE